MLPLVLVLAAGSGCSAPPDDGTGQSGDAISHEEAAKQLDFAELLINDVPASAEVRSLGVVKWAVYSAAKGPFLGIVMFATDAQGDVKYTLLVNARRAADGKVTVACAQLDKAGKKISTVDGSVLKVLTSDMKMLNERLRKRTEATPNTAQADCVVGVARVSFALISAVGLVFVAVPAAAGAATAVEFSSVLESLPLVAKAAGFAVDGVAIAANIASVWTVGVTALEGTAQALDRCGAKS